MSKTSTQLQLSKRRRSQGQREVNIIIVTILFSLNFIVWNVILLYYYLAYMVVPSTQVFSGIVGDDKTAVTYLYSWFYCATFLTSCVNPVIHFVCNSKMRIGATAVLIQVKRRLKVWESSNSR